jgi:hypothetical protein
MMKLLTSDRSWAVRKRAFRIWQKTPHQVAPMSDAQQTCQSCGTQFQGNFCPRCGQSARIGRFSFKTAFLLFLDIWGMGNRGMFRTLRDLMLRPGYMIRDYLSGCQSAYFPPFKMFFILATFTLLLTHGFNLAPEEPAKDKTETAEAPKELKVNGKTIESNTFNFVQKAGHFIAQLDEKNPALTGFLLLVLISAPLYLFFRHCPAVPDLRYSEHLVALVYTSNTYSIYRLLGEILPIGSGLFRLLAVIMVFISLSQFTGYRKRRLLRYILLTFLLCLVIFIIIIAIAAAIIGVF